MGVLPTSPAADSRPRPSDPTEPRDYTGTPAVLPERRSRKSSSEAPVGLRARTPRVGSQDGEMRRNGRVVSRSGLGLDAGLRVGVLLAAALAASWGLSACSDGSGSSETTGARSAEGASVTSADSPPQVSAGRSILAGIHADGTVPLLVAQQAFSLAVTPLPGVSIPSGPRDDTLFSATAPIRWLRAHRSELTPAQQRVADPWLDLRPGQTAATSSAIQTGATVAGRPAAYSTAGRSSGFHMEATDQQRYEAAVAHVLPTLASHFGPLGFDVPVVLDAGAEGTAYALASGGHTSCTLHVFPKGHYATGSDLTFLVAHELTHCFQDRTAVSAQLNSSGAAWAIEGGADWAGLEVSGPTGLMTGHWHEYLDHPETPLFSRSYDAVGFFAHLAESGADPWKVLIPMINATDNPGRYDNAVGGNRSTFEDSWSSGMFRGEPIPGKSWNTSGVGMPTSRPTPQQASVGSDVDAPAWTLTTADVTTDKEVTSVRAGGSVRVGSGTKLDRVVPPGSTLDLCTKDGGCACPAGSRGSPPTADARSPFSIALTGGSAGATARITGTTLEEYCKRPPPTTAAPAATSGACRFLSAAEINHITALHVGPGTDHGDTCIFVDPDQPAASPNLNMAAAIIPKVLGDLPAGAALAGVIVMIGDSGGGDGGDGGDGGGGPPGCEMIETGAGRAGGGMVCQEMGFAFAGVAGRSVASISIVYFPAPPGLDGLETAITSLISTAVSHD